MSTADETHEMDDRFPTGEWKGFFIQPDSSRRYRMDLVLQFAQDRISGRGGDFVGEFTINGAYDTATGKCSWTKQYIGQHRVEYTGQARQDGIVGQWQVPGMHASWSGPFFIWPWAAGDMESAFEKAFLENELAFIDSDVANDPDSTTNTAVPAEFAGKLAM
jgi:hypothetical protein